MYDPLTVAFEIKYPWYHTRKSPNGHIFKYHSAFITVWHRDPETDGTDDSCDWFNRKKKKFRIHPRFHFWHWQIQVNPLQILKRFLFSRCKICGKRFTWKESNGGVLACNWSGDGPGWFRNREQIMHFRCDDTIKEIKMDLEKRFKPGDVVELDFSRLEFTKEELDKYGRYTGIKAIVARPLGCHEDIGGFGDYLIVWDRTDERLLPFLKEFNGGQPLDSDYLFTPLDTRVPAVYFKLAEDQNIKTNWEKKFYESRKEPNAKL